MLKRNKLGALTLLIVLAITSMVTAEPGEKQKFKKISNTQQLKVTKLKNKDLEFDKKYKKPLTLVLCLMISHLFVQTVKTIKA